MHHHERERLGVGQEFLEAEPGGLDGLTEEHGEVAVQGVVEGHSVLVNLEMKYIVKTKAVMVDFKSY